MNRFFKSLFFKSRPALTPMGDWIVGGEGFDWAHDFDCDKDHIPVDDVEQIDERE